MSIYITSRLYNHPALVGLLCVFLLHEMGFQDNEFTGGNDLFLFLKKKIK